MLVWNQVAAANPSSGSDDSSKDKDREREKMKAAEAEKEKQKQKEKERAKQKEKEAAAAKEGSKDPSPWDDLRAHPSAFLTTKFNRPLPWPFPMGRAANPGPELWWESGTPAHVYVRWSWS